MTAAAPGGEHRRTEAPPAARPSARARLEETLGPELARKLVAALAVRRPTGTAGRHRASF